MENPCRNCVKPKRCPGCHDSCKERNKWLFLYRVDLKNEYRERLVTMQLIEMNNERKEKPIRKKPEPLRHGRKVAKV